MLIEAFVKNCYCEKVVLIDQVEGSSAWTRESHNLDVLCIVCQGIYETISVSMRNDAEVVCLSSVVFVGFHCVCVMGNM